MLISCIMPTRGRKHFAQSAVDAFCAQTWPEKELIILDDDDCRSFETAPQLDQVRYFVSEKRLKVGDKRNLAIEKSSGEVIAHWDDDDYSSPLRLKDQIERLISRNAQVTGYSTMAFEGPGGVHVYDDGNPLYIIGTSLMYRREYWKLHPFRSLQMGEDDIFKGPALRDGTSVSVPAGAMMFARIHAGNTVTKRPIGKHWRRAA